MADGVTALCYSLRIVALATKEGRNDNGIFATYWKRLLFNFKILALTTEEGRNGNGIFVTYWKRRLSIVARTAMITVAQQALRKNLHMDLLAYEDFEDEPEDDMMELKSYTR